MNEFLLNYLNMLGQLVKSIALKGAQKSDFGWDFILI